MAFWLAALKVVHIGLAMSCALLALVRPSAASEYDCHNLVRVAGQPLIEGSNGFFFRTVPDLTEHFPLGERTVTLMKALSSALAARGTQLVYVPIPAKGSVSGPFLPSTEIEGMFDQSLALHSYGAFVATLRAAGIVSVDVATAINAKRGEPPAFLGADHHWTSDGARRAARAVAAAMKPLPAYQKLSKSSLSPSALERSRSPPACGGRFRRPAVRRCRQTKRWATKPNSPDRNRTGSQWISLAKRPVAAA